MYYGTIRSMMAKKQVAIAKITDPSLVQARCTAQGWVYDDGAIFCHIPELGLEGTNFVYCRYGLAIPYYKVQVGQKLLIEPTIEEYERWFYVGFVDCGGYSPADADQLMIQLLSQVIYASTSGKIHLSNKSASEPFVLGDVLSIYLGDLVSNINQNYDLIKTSLGSIPAPTP